MKYSNHEKITILIGIVGVIAILPSIFLSFCRATINNDLIPLIVFITTSIYYELRDTYKIRRSEEIEHNIERRK
jgi:hypothetical protein